MESLEVFALVAQRTDAPVCPIKMRRQRDGIANHYFFIGCYSKLSVRRNSAAGKR